MQRIRMSVRSLSIAGFFARSEIIRPPPVSWRNLIDVFFAQGLEQAPAVMAQT